MTKNNFSLISKFKHNTVGKFQMIEELLSDLNESNLHSDETREILDELIKTFDVMKKSTQELVNEIDNK
jgi:hypothetical protein